MNPGKPGTNVLQQGGVGAPSMSRPVTVAAGMAATTAVGIPVPPTPTQYVLPGAVPFSAAYPVQAFQAVASPMAVGPQQLVPSQATQVYGQWFPSQVAQLQGFQPGISPIQPSDEVEKLARWEEEQKRLRKERQFQVQQQRLKQFDVSGAKSGALSSSKTLLENMFGKGIDAKNVSRSTTKTAAIPPPASTPSGLPAGRQTPPPPATVNQQQQQTSSTQSEAVRKIGLPVSASASDPKALDDMMRVCSDLSASPKAKVTFQKSATTTAAAVQAQSGSKPKPMFVASQKACDWKNVHLDELGEMFTIKRPKFPPWCCREKVPQLYHLVEDQATEKGAHAIDTAILYPILISSHLPRDILGRIWEMVNQTTPGQLTSEELYAALALIALAQSGNSVQTIDILHMLPHPPVPVLQASFAAPSPQSDNQQHLFLSMPYVAENQGGSNNIAAPSPAMVVSSQPVVQDLQHQQTMVTSAPASQPFLGPSSDPGANDDEFDEFKSAPVPQFASAVKEPTDEDFSEFKQACVSQVPPFAPRPFKAEAGGMQATTDLMATEDDKYSIFRMLQTSSDTEWSIVAQEQKGETEPSQAPDATPESGETANRSSEPASKEDDDFGDFLCAAANSAEPAKTDLFSSVPQLKQDQPSVVVSFANFDQFQQSIAKQSDDEFSNFASFEAAPSTPTCHGISPPDGQTGIEDDFDNLSLNQANGGSTDGGSSIVPSAKDNLSSAESQSISSLELAGYDSSALQVVESSLGRHGSVPSLDLKVAEGSEIDEGGFGDILGAPLHPFGGKFGKPLSVSACSSPDISCMRENSSPLPSAAVHGPPHIPSAVLADRYSSIRPPSQGEDSDRHISEWMRCLSSCLELFETACKIFGGISSSSVCDEVLSTSEGSDYIKNLTEVYRVVCRISVSAESVGKKTDKLKALLTDIESAWQSIQPYVDSPLLLPPKVIRTNGKNELNSFAASDSSQDACGVCLLSVEESWPEGGTASTKTNETLFLSYGGRQYHTTCANLWVNCVEPLLPCLPLPQLL